MVDAASARVGHALRNTAKLLLGAMIATGGVSAAWADQPPAPIIYATPTTKAMRLENRAASAPVVAPAAVEQPKVTFDQFQGRTPLPPAGPIEMRPSAMVEPASFGPAIPSYTPAPAITPAARPLTAPSAAAGFTAPFAGPPYEVDGKWYVPAYEPDYDEVGVASWYGPNFHGKASATGEEYDQNAFTAAHPTLPIPSLVRVTNLENGKSIVVRLNDRGPFVDDRLIDLSRATANALGVVEKGTAKVRVQYVGPVSADANTNAGLTSAPVPVQTQFTAKPLAPVSTPSPVAVPAKAAGQGGASVRDNDSLKGFYLQAGSFSDLGNAHKLRDKLAGNGQVFVTTAKVDGVEFYRVMLGPWNSREGAEQAQAQLSARTIVVARGG